VLMSSVGDGVCLIEFEQLFALNHIGVLVHLADACHRLNVKQKSFIKVSDLH